MKKSQDWHDVKIIVVTQLLLSLFADIVIQLIANIMQTSFQAIYSAIYHNYPYILFLSSSGKIRII